MDGGLLVGLDCHSLVLVIAVVWFSLLKTAYTFLLKFT